ncbi:Methyl-accepting chemotaxis protein II [Cupriavidus pinatubonensis]|uniref:Methyl-accepting chemotaxis protein II n=2 Tax=Cupriavidus pinatubonensis TaxID=248026 RepID=A0ABN7YJP6_9BURK|nr:Methyl-accepting chemotaxis protein II [Cupriavidus pinatubonensis]
MEGLRSHVPDIGRQVLVKQYANHNQKFRDEAITPALAALRAGDAQRLDALVRGPMKALYTPTRKDLGALIELQLNVGKAEYEASQSRYKTVFAGTVAALAIGILLAIVVGVWLTRAITVPLSRAVDLARRVAKGDLTPKIAVTSRDEVGELLQALKEMVQSLTGIVTQVRGNADTIATASAQIASGNSDLSTRTEEQASSLEETAASMEQMTATVRQNADNARQANALVTSASETAAKGGEVVSRVVHAMGSISTSANKIADIIGVIDGIAFQTNILALNAAVEAARAGEQGRGFAVVAGEVRTLAQRSATAAKEIKTLIETSVGQVESGNALVGEAGATMDQVVAAVRRVADLMGEITAAGEEQSSGIQQVNTAVTQMDQVTQQNAALVEEAAAAAESLQERARDLSAAVAVFQTGQVSGGHLALLSCTGLDFGMV